MRVWVRSSEGSALEPRLVLKDVACLGELASAEREVPQEIGLQQDAQGQQKKTFQRKKRAMCTPYDKYQKQEDR